MLNALQSLYRCVEAGPPQHGRIRHWGKWGKFPHQDSEAQNLLGNFPSRKESQNVMNTHSNGESGNTITTKCTFCQAN